MSQEKAAILQDSEFTIEEGFLYRFSRTGAIWMNKLFFGALVLLGVWLILGTFGAVDPGCTDSFDVVGEGNATADVPSEKCSVWLSPTAKYLGAMSVFSFILSIGFGLLGIVVGKNIMEVARSDEEVGAGPKDADDGPE